MIESIRVLAPAKVNLRLVILSRETTGYHNLETIFSGISLADRIQVWPARDLDFEVSDAKIDAGPPEENLVVRAARAFYARCGIEPAVRIRLEKRIPSAAGLGGGSSDAAATLRLLNSLHGKPLRPSELLDCGAALGSDVPFFLTRTPFALAWGRGERLLSLRPPPARAAVVVRTGVDVSTAWAFGRLRVSREGGRRVTESVHFSRPDLQSWERLAHLATNDFEEIVTELIPSLPEIRSILREANAHIAMLSGSGGAIFGIFSSPYDAARAHEAVARIGLDACRTHTLERWPSVERLQC